MNLPELENVWSGTLMMSGSEVSGSTNSSTMWSSEQLDNMIFQFPDGFVDSVVSGSDSSIPNDLQNASNSFDCQPLLPPSLYQGPLLSKNEIPQNTSTCIESCTLAEPLNKYDKRLKVRKDSMKRERRFVCTAAGCGKSFAKKWNLQAHKRLHSGAKPFQCRLGCGERYMWMSSLKSHENRKCSLLPASQRFQRRPRSTRPEVPIFPSVQINQAPPSTEDKLLFEFELEQIIARF